MAATETPTPAPPHGVCVHLVSRARAPVLEYRADEGEGWTRVPFEPDGPGRRSDERSWRAEVAPGRGAWQLRVDLGRGKRLAPAGAEHFVTSRDRVWLQDGQLFDYPPAALVSPSAVVRLPPFVGSLPSRALYVYLPRGYHDHPDRRYPVLFMHDGQNCFAAYEGDSYAGSWQADVSADRLIAQGLMRECLIVGVANGQSERLVEYLPPYSAFVEATRAKATGSGRARTVRQRLSGRADKTAAYYRTEVAPFIAERYRTLEGREHTATCGSSMGGLFSAYLAWEHPEFARHHAIMSPSFWITRRPDGRVETIERIREGPKRDLRLWLDSGTRDAVGRGDDNLRETVLARDALLELGYLPGDDFGYLRAEGAAHHESAWAARLPRVFAFLFPG